MTITLTKEELEKFSGDLSKWYYESFDFIMKNLNLDMFSVKSGTIFEQMRKLRQKFEQQNPKPDWKSLL